MKFKEIIEALQQHYSSALEFSQVVQTYVPGIGKIEEVSYDNNDEDSYGYYSWYKVKHIVDYDIYIRIEGYYSSYHGNEVNGWDSCQVVIPREKKTIEYVNVNDL